VGMKTKLTKFGIYVFSISGFVVAFFVGMFIIEEIVVGDPCQYHPPINKKTNFVFDLFFAAHGGSNSHPEATLLNLIVTLSLGVLLGIIVSRFFIKIIFGKNKNEVSEVLDKFE